MDGLTVIIIFWIIQLQIQVITIALAFILAYKFYKLIKEMFEELKKQSE